MLDIEVNKTKNLTVPAGATSVHISHAWGDEVADTTGLTPGDTYAFTPNSIEVHKVVWRDGTTIVKTDFYNVIMPTITSLEFFSEFSELDSEEEKFAGVERRVRHIIEVFTGQKFGPYIDKTLSLQGDGGDTLELPVRIISYSLLTDQFGEDLTDYTEIAAGEPYFIQYRDRFRRPFYQDYKRDLSTERRKQDFFTDKLDFSITGNFGWEYVPAAITDAAKLLIADDFNGSNDLRRNGINEAQLGDFSYKLNADQWGTTGNTQADMLLADFTIMRFGNI